MSISKTIVNLAVLSCLLLAQVSCAKKSVETAEKSAVTSSQQSAVSFEVQGDSSEVVAKVNNTVITYNDLERMTSRTLKGAELFDLGSEVQEKILQSMVASRVMAQAAVSELDEDERETLDRDVRDYREQLLVKSYLKNNANPQPITQEMVKTYYDSHPEKFGGGKVKSFELIAGINGVSENERNSIVAAMGKANKQNNWQTYVNELRNSGHKVSYVQGKLKKDLLDKRLTDVIDRLRPGTPAKVVFVDGIPYLPRGISEEVATAKPLSEVSSEIRRMLLPQQLKKSIKTLSEELMKTADVEYSGEATQTSDEQ